MGCKENSGVQDSARNGSIPPLTLKRGTDMRGSIAIGLLAASLAGCAPTQMYYVKSGVGLQQTAKDLHECRQTARATSERQIYTARELEGPCMGAKGYLLSDKPPATP